MWADTYVHNSIQSSIEKNPTDGHFLRVIFNNNDDQDRWLSNIAIHPIGEQALDNRSNDRLSLNSESLKIKARVQKNDDTYLENIAIILRVCDKNLTYWEYANVPGQFTQICVATGDWQDIHVDLTNHNQWQKFKSDGNRENPSLNPDFSVISGVVLALGGYNNIGQNPKPGKGMIDIHEISLK